MHIFLNTDGWMLVAMVLWIIPWKGYALWTAARRSDRGWFIGLLITQTFGLLEILYIFRFAKKKPEDMLAGIKKTASRLLR